jgi:hypothetical protein
MESQSRIMVCLAESEWTQEAIYQACILARKTDGELALVKMVTVQHLGWLGTEFGNIHITQRDRQVTQEYKATAEDYGVTAIIHYFQYVTLDEAIVQAANHVKADTVFATLPTSLIPYWRRLQLYILRERLTQENCVLMDTISTKAAFKTTESFARSR